ncbi:MAG: hypothetical protein IKJ78_07565 [Bacteroidales bacterium]|nr:hypothetical protein [Bacteroidales bacterium]
MKTRRIIFALMATVLMVGCGVNTQKVGFEYDNPERYQSGDATYGQSISDIDIDWYGGDIDIVYGDGPEVRLREESVGELTDTFRVHHYVDEDGCLHINVCKSGKNYSAKRLKGMRKHLFIEVPRDMPLNDIEVDGVDTRLVIDRVKHNELTVDGVNVNVNALYTAMPDEITMDGVRCLLALQVAPDAGLTIEMDGVLNHLRCDVPSVKKDKKTIVGDGSCQVTVDGVDMIVDVIELI